jgi:hypothetical protein
LNSHFRFQPPAVFTFVVAERVLLEIHIEVGVNVQLEVSDLADAASQNLYPAVHTCDLYPVSKQLVPCFGGKCVRDDPVVV